MKAENQKSTDALLERGINRKWGKRPPDVFVLLESINHLKEGILDARFFQIHFSDINLVITKSFQCLNSHHPHHQISLKVLFDTRTIQAHLNALSLAREALGERANKYFSDYRAFQVTELSGCGGFQIRELFMLQRFSGEKKETDAMQSTVHA